MDSFELNKIIGAILGTLLFVMGVGFLAESIYHPTASGPGYALPEPEGGCEGDNGGTETPVVSIGTLLASADAIQGERTLSFRDYHRRVDALAGGLAGLGIGHDDRVCILAQNDIAADAKQGADQAKKCGACHDLTEAGANKTGPGLYDVVERVVGSHPGFAYSPVLKEHQAKGDAWTYDNLNQFLISPKAFAPGTKMTFAGVKNDQERANIIAFLSTLSASPKPFPPPDAAPAEPSGEPAASSEEPAASSEEPAASSEPAPESSEAPASSEASSAAQ